MTDSRGAKPPDAEPPAVLADDAADESAELASGRDSEPGELASGRDSEPAEAPSELPKKLHFAKWYSREQYRARGFLFTSTTSETRTIDITRLPAPLQEQLLEKHPPQPKLEATAPLQQKQAAVQDALLIELIRIREGSTEADARSKYQSAKEAQQKLATPPAAATPPAGMDETEQAQLKEQAKLITETQDYLATAAGSLAYEIIKRSALVDQAKKVFDAALPGDEKQAAQEALERAKIHLKIFLDAATTSLEKRQKEINAKMQDAQEAELVKQLTAEKRDIERLQQEVHRLHGMTQYQSHYTIQFSTSQLVTEEEAQRLLSQPRDNTFKASSGEAGFTAVTGFTPGMVILSQTDLGKVGGITWAMQQTSEEFVCKIHPAKDIHPGSGSAADYLGAAIRLVEGFRQATGGMLPGEITGKSDDLAFDARLAQAIVFYCQERYGVVIANKTPSHDSPSRAQRMRDTMRDHLLRRAYVDLTLTEESPGARQAQQRQKHETVLPGSDPRVLNKDIEEIPEPPPPPPTRRGGSRP